MTILITGGAGYIGSHTAKLLEQRGHNVVIFDSLAYGHKEIIDRLPKPCVFVEGNLFDAKALIKLFREHAIDAVMHFAAFAQIAESVKEPGKYFWNNTAGTISLLNAMLDAQVHHLIFSSTCAIYGVPNHIPIDEEEPKKPENPYGRSKLLVEMAMQDYAHHTPLQITMLRYFNACGADPEGKLGEDHTPETHLIPLILQTALGQRESIKIFGTDYPTPDGTAVRDYIHVLDLAEAHLAALEQQVNGQEKLAFYNIGTGKGYSVKEIIEHCRNITGSTIHIIETDRRPGDPPKLVANPKKIKDELRWQPKYSSIDNIIQTAWDWHKSHPHGYTQS